MDMDIGQGSPAAGPRRTLRHADAVTEDGTWAVHAFLMPRPADCEGYDHARWHRVAFPDAAAEAEYERSVTELGLRRRGGAPGGG
ncbi:hypothetical protein [Streptomyces xanthophaeus]|uniref:hypothetical protein n=1 Tax=Streptomyces xanthophaeus TaxID=67385 RepID=UPI0004CCF307|nr:hypothetical protein [Streptomyces xanthophaeus]